MHRPPPEPRTRLAAYALCVDDQQAMLLCRIAPGYPAAGQWTLPGGGVTFGEDPANTVIRELAEETGLTGEIRSIAFVHSGSGVNEAGDESRQWHAVRIVYWVEVTGGQLRDENDESTDRAAWIRLDEVNHLPVVEMAHVALEHARAPAVKASKSDVAVT